MSKPTVSAVGGAMSASGQPNIADAFDQTRHLIIAASNLAAGPDPYKEALHAVIIAAEEQFGIAHDWFLGRRDSAPTSGQTSSEADRNLRLELLDIVNNMDEVRYLVEATWMAVESLSDTDEQAPLHVVLSVAKQKLTAARDRLNVARGGKQVLEAAQ